MPEEPALVTPSLVTTTVSGLRWTTLGEVLRQVVQFGSTVAMSRLLVPEDFGIYAMVAVFSGFVLIIADLGFAAAVIQRDDLHDDHVNAAFWMNIAAGLALAAVLCAAAPLIAALYGDNRLVPLTFSMTVVVVLSSIPAMHRALLVRDLAFRKIVLVEVPAILVGCVAGVAAAVADLGYWSMVVQAIGTAAAMAAIYWFTSPWRPARQFDRVAARSIAGFGLNLTGFTVVNYWSRNADNLLIGKSVGPAELGLYSRAYSLMVLPVTQVGSIVGRVFFPVLSRIQDDIPRVRRGYLRAVRMIAAISFPTLIGAALVAPEMLPLAFGSEWTGAVPLFQVLALAGVPQAIGTTTGWIFLSQGRPDVMFRWGIFATVVTVIAFAIGIEWGAMGVATAYAIRTYLLVGLNFWIAGRLIDLKARAVAKVVGPVVFATAVMAAAVTFVGVVGEQLPGAVDGLVQSLVGVGVYVCVSLAFRVEAFSEVVQLMRGRNLAVESASQPQAVERTES